MATDFWASSNYKRWIIDRASLNQARLEDLQFIDVPDYLDYLAIFFANVITKLGKKLQFRQRIIATATVFFRRFYLKNSYCETDPFIVIAACCYLAAKAEESPVHIKVVVSESRALFNQENYNIKAFSCDNGQLAEMEFYLVDDLECDLVIFHPYRTLLSLCKKEVGSEEGETEEIGIGVGADDGPRYWGTGQGQLEFTPAALQTAWSIINDTYRSQLCLLYPPHLIAIAAIYLTFILHPPIRPITQSSESENVNDTSTEPARQPRRSSRQAGNHTHVPHVIAKKPNDPITFLSELNVSLHVVATIVQEIISLYTLWDQYKEDVSPDASKLVRELADSPSPSKSTRNGASGGCTPGVDETLSSEPDGTFITPSFLVSVLQKMRDAKAMHVARARQSSIPVNKRLERTQAAG